MKITKVPSVWMWFPPAEVFLDPEKALWGYQAKQEFELKDWHIELPKLPDDEEFGMFFKGLNDKFFYSGIAVPIIVYMVAVVKNTMLNKLKSLRNPFMWFGLKDLKREIGELSNVSLRRYYLKPNRYCRAVREVYRIMELIFPKRAKTVILKEWIEIPEELDLVHLPCMVLEFDNAYRSPFQAFWGNMNRELLASNPRKAISEELEYCAENDENEKRRGHWKLAKIAFDWLWYVPKFKKVVKMIAKEIKIDEISPTQADLYWQFK